MIDPRIDRGLMQDKGTNQKERILNHDGNHRENLWKRSVDVLMKQLRERSTSKKPAHDVELARQYSPTMDGLEHALIDAVSCWSNVIEFSANWWESTPVRQLESFLPFAWSTFGRNLQKVSLGGNLARIQTLVSSAHHLPSLRELRFEFTNNILRVDDVADMTTLADVIAPLINSVSSTLETLAISSWASIDLSEFFLKLGFFPLLRHFTARVPFNKAFSVNPDGFTRLLRDHSHTLTSVALRLNPSGSMVNPSTEESLCSWMTSTSSDPLILNNLTTIQMYPTSLATGFEAFLTFLGRSADTLTEVRVRDRYLSYDEVESVISTFSHRPAASRLTILRLNVRILSLRLIDLFAATLPALFELCLYTGESWRDGGVEGTPSVSQHSSSTQEFC